MLKRPSPWRRNPAGLYRPLLRVSFLWNWKVSKVFSNFSKVFKRFKKLNKFKTKSKRTRNPSMAWQAGVSRSRATCTRMTRPNRPVTSSWKVRANLPQSPRALSPVWVMAHSHEFILIFQISNLTFSTCDYPLFKKQITAQVCTWRVWLQCWLQFCTCQQQSCLQVFCYYLWRHHDKNALVPSITKRKPNEGHPSTRDLIVPWLVLSGTLNDLISSGSFPSSISPHFRPYLNPRLRRRKADIAPCQIRLLLGRTSHLTFTSGELSRKVGVALARVNQQHFRPGPIVANFNIGIELFDLEFFRAFFDPINVKVSVLWAEIGNKIIKSLNIELQKTVF